MSDNVGIELVRLARRTVANRLLGQPLQADHGIDNGIKAGTFVTLYRIDGQKREILRGCVGFPVPEKRLGQSIIDCAIAAAFEDPRFEPLESNELDHVIFEVSVLTEPQEIMGEPKDRISKIKIGRDGLILHWKYGSGLLLPQVAIELKWTIEDYLLNICGKAGAPLEEWSRPSSRLYSFQATVYKEIEPNGRIERLAI